MGAVGDAGPLGPSLAVGVKPEVLLCLRSRSFKY